MSIEEMMTNTSPSVHEVVEVLCETTVGERHVHAVSDTLLRYINHHPLLSSRNDLKEDDASAAALYASVRKLMLIVPSSCIDSTSFLLSASYNPKVHKEMTKALLWRLKSDKKIGFYCVNLIMRLSVLVAHHIGHVDSEDKGKLSDVIVLNSMLDLIFLNPASDSIMYYIKRIKSEWFKQLFADRVNGLKPSFEDESEFDPEVSLQIERVKRWLSSYQENKG